MRRHANEKYNIVVDAFTELLKEKNESELNKLRSELSLFYQLVNHHSCSRPEAALSYIGSNYGKEKEASMMKILDILNSAKLIFRDFYGCISYVIESMSFIVLKVVKHDYGSSITGPFGHSLISFSVSSSGEFLCVTVSCRSELLNCETDINLMVKDAINHLTTIAGGRLILFSDASSSRTFSLMKKFVGEDFFVYLVEGVQNPNTGNLMDVATIKESINEYNDLMKKGGLNYTNTVLHDFLGLCGGLVVSSESAYSNKLLRISTNYHGKKGLLMISYKLSDDEMLKLDASNEIVHEDLPTVRVIKLK